MSDTLWGDLPTITGGGLADSDTFAVLDESTTTVKQITKAELASAISTLYDATTHTAVLIADSGSVSVQPGIEFDGLGKYTDDGYNSADTWFDAASTVWSDNGWLNVQYDSGGLGLTVGAGGVADGAPASGSVQWFAFQEADVFAEVGMTARVGASAYQVLSFDATRDLVDPTNNLATFTLTALPPQTGALFQILANNATTATFAVSGDNKLGFFNHAVAAQPAGVPVTAAGVHAAGVALGLWTT